MVKHLVPVPIAVPFQEYEQIILGIATKPLYALLQWVMPGHVDAFRPPVGRPGAYTPAAGFTVGMGQSRGEQPSLPMSRSSVRLVLFHVGLVLDDLGLIRFDLESLLNSDGRTHMYVATQVLC